MTTVMTFVTITRRRDPLEGQRVAVLRRWRRKHGRMDLLVVLPNGRKRLIPQTWTDADPSGAAAVDVDGPAATLNMTLGAVEDLVAAVVLVSALGRRACVEQAASQSPCEEDFDAACPAQSAPNPVADATRGRVGRASGSRGARGNRAVGTPDRQGGRRRQGGAR
jgi:hypothetical protein